MNVIREHKEAAHHEECYVNLMNCLNVRHHSLDAGDPSVDVIDSVTKRMLGTFSSSRLAYIAIAKAVKAVVNAPPHSSWETPAAVQESAESLLLKEWTRARKLRDTSTGSKRQRYYQLADELQYKLQDMSPLGYRMVWGSEYSKARSYGTGRADDQRSRPTADKDGPTAADRHHAAEREYVVTTHEPGYTTSSGTKIPGPAHAVGHVNMKPHTNAWTIEAILSQKVGVYAPRGLDTVKWATHGRTAIVKDSAGNTIVVLSQVL